MGSTIACTGASHTGNAPGVVLDQDAEEALDGAIQRAVHHQRLVRLAVFADILQPEAARQREIELHGGELPRAADGVHQLHVDLGPVERGFVGHHLGFDVQPLGRRCAARSRQLPLLGRAVVLAAGAAVPGGKLGFVLARSRRCAAYRWRTAGSPRLRFRSARACRRCARRPA